MAVLPDQARVHTARLSAGLQLDSSPGPIFCPCTVRAHPLYNSPRTGCRSSMLTPAGRTTRLAAVPSCSVLAGCEHSRVIPPPPRLTRTSGSSRVHRCRGGLSTASLGVHHRSSAVRHIRSPRSRPPAACLSLQGYCSGWVPRFVVACSLALAGRPAAVRSFATDFGRPAGCVASPRQRDAPTAAVNVAVLRLLLLLCVHDGR